MISSFFRWVFLLVEKFCGAVGIVCLNGGTDVVVKVVAASARLQRGRADSSAERLFYPPHLCLIFRKGFAALLDWFLECGIR